MLERSIERGGLTAEGGDRCVDRLYKDALPVKLRDDTLVSQQFAVIHKIPCFAVQENVGSENNVITLYMYGVPSPYVPRQVS